MIFFLIHNNDKFRQKYHCDKHKAEHAGQSESLEQKTFLQIFTSLRITNDGKVGKALLT